MENRLARIMIVNSDKCKPKKCGQECNRSCPVVRSGKLCVEVSPASKIASISEELCIGCGICVKKCPFSAIQIINLPKNLDKDTTHRYGANSFKLHRILAGHLKPNLGRFDNSPEWQEILTYFQGSELQNYFTLVLEEDLKAILKPQYVDNIPREIQGTVGEVLNREDQRGLKEELCVHLELNQVLDRNVGDLSGGELQRFAIAVAVMKNAKIYFVCCLYGKPSAYGVVTLPFSVREGINIFLAGFIPTENLRFRDESLTFKVSETPEKTAEGIQSYDRYRYSTMTKTFGKFKLHVMEREFTDS
ncbi:hypothetical protein ACLB2K_024786 [Fragaria x ananassa]